MVEELDLWTRFPKPEYERLLRWLDELQVVDPLRRYFAIDMKDGLWFVLRQGDKVEVN